MKKVILSFVLLSVFSSLSGQNRESIENDKQLIKAHIESIFQAFQDQDVDQIRSTHSKDWTGFQSDSEEIVRGRKAYMKGSLAAMEKFQMTSFGLHEIEIQHFGQLAVVYYVAKTTYHIKGDESLTFPV